MSESDKQLPTLEKLQQDISNAAATKAGNNGTTDTDEASARTTARAASLAWSVISGASVGIFGGYGIDRWLNTSPIFLLVGFFVGFATGVYALMRKVK